MCLSLSVLLGGCVQSINAADVARMSKEKLKVEEVLRTVSTQKDRLEKDVWEQEVQVSPATQARGHLHRNAVTEAGGVTL
jgi:hypothetical protein